MGLTPQKVTLVYWQHYAKHEEEFSSFDEALGHAVYLESYMAGAPERITDGARVVEGEELSGMIWERERTELDALKAPPYHPDVDLIDGLSKRAQKRLRSTYTPVRDLRDNDQP